MLEFHDVFSMVFFLSSHMLDETASTHIQLIREGFARFWIENWGDYGVPSLYTLDN